jgi:hypothetical protein
MSFSLCFFVIVVAAKELNFCGYVYVDEEVNASIGIFP